MESALRQEQDERRIRGYQVEVAMMLRGVALDSEQEWETRFHAAHILLRMG